MKSARNFLRLLRLRFKPFSSKPRPGRRIPQAYPAFSLVLSRNSRISLTSAPYFRLSLDIVSSLDSIGQDARSCLRLRPQAYRKQVSPMSSASSIQLRRRSAIESASGINSESLSRAPAASHTVTCGRRLVSGAERRVYSMDIPRQLFV